MNEVACILLCQTKVKEYEEGGKKVHEEVQLDYEKEVEIIRLQHEGEASDGGIVVLDFKRVQTPLSMLL